MRDEIVLQHVPAESNKKAVGPSSWINSCKTESEGTVLDGACLSNRKCCRETIGIFCVSAENSLTPIASQSNLYSIISSPPPPRGPRLKSIATLSKVMVFSCTIYAVKNQRGRRGDVHTLTHTHRPSHHLTLRVPSLLLPTTFSACESNDHARLAAHVFITSRQ